MASTGIPEGDLLRLQIGAGRGTKIGHATGSGFDSQLALQEIASKDTGGGNYTESIAGKLSWTKNCEFLYNFDDTIDGENRLTIVDLFNAQKSRQPIDVRCTTGVQGDTEWHGKAFVTGLTATGNTGEVATGSFTLTGTGELTASAVPAV